MYIIITIIVGLFLWYISRQTDQQPINIEGKSLLKFNPIFGLIGLGCMCLGLFMPFYSWIIDDFTTDGLLIMFGLLVFFFGIGYWLFSWSRHHKVLFDESEIIVIESKNREIKFQWSDIQDIRLNTWTSKYILTLKSQQKVSIHQYLTGIEDFIKRVRNVK
jgi:apolipoprotein N-acyltransferase